MSKKKQLVSQKIRKRNEIEEKLDKIQGLREVFGGFGRLAFLMLCFKGS
jgi:hypothetical protein